MRSLLVIPPHRVHINVMILSSKIYSSLDMSHSLSRYLFFLINHPTFHIPLISPSKNGWFKFTLLCPSPYPILIQPPNLQSYSQICHYQISNNTPIMPHIHNLSIVNTWKTHSNPLLSQFNIYL